MAKFEVFTLVCAICVVIGQASPTSRIVGGADAYEGQFPYQISLRRNGSHSCGGSIISRNFVLTAAHCVGTTDSSGSYYTYDPSIFTVRAGSTDRFRGGVLVNVKEIITHEDYGDFLNDVALLRLSQSLIYSTNIQAIELADKELSSGTSVIISGWGRLKTGGDLPQKLQWNTLKSISRTQCKLAINMDSDTLLCLSHSSNNGACNGDSGGPAVYDGKVVGVAGFVYGSCGTRYPDGYAKVYYHVAWIKKNAGL